MADDQREEFASRIETLLSELKPEEYPSLKAQVKWSEMEQTIPPKTSDASKESSSKNVRPETINAFQGPVKMNRMNIQNIIGKHICLQQVPVSEYRYPQQFNPYGYQQQPQPPKKEETIKAPQVEALMERLNKSK